MSALPTDTVTVLFSDIVGSTRLWERDPAAMQAALDRHDTILRNSIEGHGGYVFKTVGDAFCAIFTTASGALEAALQAQRALLVQDWGGIGPLRVRMALHAGTANERGRLFRAFPQPGGEARLGGPRRAGTAVCLGLRANRGSAARTGRA